LAFTQPILDALARNTDYRIEANVRWPELIGLMGALIVGVPVLAIVVDQFFRIARRLRDSVMFYLAMLAALGFVRPLGNWLYLSDLGAWRVTCMLALCAGAAVVVLRQRSGLFRQWLTITALGAVFFPAIFTARLAIPRKSHGLPTNVAIQNPAPVILIVFDEFSGLTLMNDKLDIDAERFPQFARLASSSTWYRNATSVHARTPMAVPAILSGRFPGPDCEPDPPNYPRNLFDLISAGSQHEMTVFEPTTRLFSHVAALKPDTRPYGQRLGGLLCTLALVYPELILPRDAPIPFPDVPRVWFGMTDSAVRETSGREHYGWNVSRDTQWTRFLPCIRRGDRPPFCFLHLLLPHFPWCFYPSGNHYLALKEAPLLVHGALGELGEDWPNDPPLIARWEHRYVLQVGYVDRCVGELLDQVHSSGLWDSCLLIVTADHGVSFRPGHSRRVPDAQTLPDLMSVPLYVKYPGQSAGRIDDRNVEAVDLLPTICDVLGISPDDPRDGGSLLQSPERLRKTFAFEGQSTVIEPDFPQKTAAVARHRAIFDARSVEPLPTVAISHPEWCGHRLDEFTIRDSGSNTLELWEYHAALDASSHFVPGLIEGCVRSADLGPTPGDIALAVDGVVVDICRTFPLGFDRHGFSMLLAETVASTPGHTLELFVVTPESVLIRLHVWST